jgi:hypothetical protein
MAPPLLILPPRISDDSVKLWRAAGRLGWDVERLATWRLPFDLSNQRGRDVVVYGGLMFILADELDLALLEPPLDWLTTVPPEHLGRKIVFTTLAEARRYSERAFFKAADEKAFPPGVYDRGALPASDLLSPDTVVLISEPVEMELEFRCFVRDSTVLTLSPYLRDGTRVETEEGRWPATDQEYSDAEAFAVSVLADERVRLPPAVVLDVARVPGGGWVVIEVNPCWGSGVYGCDPEKALDVIRRACVPRARLTDEDRRWLRAATPMI